MIEKPQADTFMTKSIQCSFQFLLKFNVSRIQSINACKLRQLNGKFYNYIKNIKSNLINLTSVFLFICGQYIGNAGSKHFKLITKLLKELQSKCILTHQCCMQLFQMEFAK